MAFTNAPGSRRVSSLESVARRCLAEVTMPRQKKSAARPTDSSGVVALSACQPSRTWNSRQQVKLNSPLSPSFARKAHSVHGQVALEIVLSMLPSILN